MVSARTASGYTVEFAVPIASVGVSELKLRDEFSVDFGISDVDVAGAGLRTQATWTVPWKTAKWTASSIDDPSNEGFSE